MRSLCDKLGGDYFPRKQKCLIDGKFHDHSEPPVSMPYYSTGTYTQPQPYFVMLGVVGALAAGWVIFGQSK